MSKAIITPGDVFFYTTNSRVNTESIINNSWIVLSQLRHIRPILTNNLYEAYIAAPADYSDLDDYIRPALAYFCLLDYIDKVHIKITDNGIYKVVQQSNTAASDEEKQQLKSSLYADALMWAKELTSYLNDNYASNDNYDSSENIYNQMTMSGGFVWLNENTND